MCCNDGWTLDRTSVSTSAPGTWWVCSVLLRCMLGSWQRHGVTRCSGSCSPQTSPGIYVNIFGSFHQGQQLLVSTLWKLNCVWKLIWAGNISPPFLCNFDNNVWILLLLHNAYCTPTSKMQCELLIPRWPYIPSATIFHRFYIYGGTVVGIALLECEFLQIVARILGDVLG